MSTSERSVGPGAASREIDELLLRIRGLVRARELLRARGMPSDVLDEHSAEIGRLQSLLAEHVRESLTPRADQRG